MTDKTEAQPEALRLELHQKCADFATSLRSAANVVQLQGQKAPPSFLKAADLFEQAASEIQQLKAQLSARQAVPNPWQQAIDHELVCLHLGVAGEATKESALKALQELIQCHVEIAINPQTNGGLSLQPHTEAQAVPDGWRLVPVEPTEEMIRAGNVKTWVLPCGYCWSAMLSAAPPPPEREPLSDDQWQALADALDGIINRELKDKISTILQLPTE